MHQKGRRTLVFVAVMTAGLTASASQATAAPGKGPTLQPGVKMHKAPKLPHQNKAIQKPIINHEIDPSVAALRNIKPLRNNQKVVEFNRRGIDLRPSALRGPISLTPRRLWVSREAHIATLHQGYVVPGDDPGHVDFSGSYRGALEIRITAAANTAYLFDCSMSGAGRSLAWVSEGSNSARVEQVETDNRFTHAVGSGPRRTVTILLAGEKSWHWSQCTVTPAAL